MPTRVCFALIILLVLPLLTTYPAWNQAATAAPPDTAPALAATTNAGSAPPPIGRGCGRGATPIDYANAICCVSGYVYLNGAPIAGAEVTVSVAGRSYPTQTQSDPEGTSPSFFASLDAEPLNAKPGDTVTITARAYGQSKTVSFTAEEGGQQIDVVLPQIALDAAWITAETPFPVLREAAIAYDAAREQVVLFGGFVREDSSDAFSDTTWLWDGRAWLRRVPPVVPPARAGHTMAYDAARERVVLFGGIDASGQALYDTWEWDGTTWVQHADAAAPAFSTPPQMVSDAARERVLLVGGDTADTSRLATWAWDGITWTKLAPQDAPAARDDFALAYDSVRERVVLFGGIHNGNRLSDTWEWDGATWARKFPVSPPSARAHHAMTYDATRERVLLVGGVDNTSTTPQADTWEWDGAAWRSTTLHLPPRADALLAYDAARQHPVMAGGYADASASTYPNETWELDSIDWNQRAPRISPSVVNWATMAYDPVRRRAMVFNGSTWEWDGINWTRLHLETEPDVLDGAAIVYDPARQRILLFGGGGYGDSLSNETWEWDGATWTRLNPAIAPPARRNHNMVYDTVRQRVVLFGGRDATQQNLYDTWEWDGITWIEHTSAVSPTDFVYGFFASMAYDPIGEQTLLLQPNRTWAWDGTQWTELAPAHYPKFHSDGYGPMIYDPESQHILAFGEDQTSAAQWALWEWDGINWTQRNLENTPPPHRNSSAMVYDSARQRFVLVQQELYSGVGVADTWEWDGYIWSEYFDEGYVPGQLSDAAMGYTQNGYSLLFGGRRSDGSLSNRTFHWQSNSWQQLSPMHTPAARRGHRIAHPDNGSSLLLFGGVDATATYLDDTWQWNGNDWRELAPVSSPPARAYHSLTYDSQRDLWLLFGGQDDNNYRNDTWAYDGLSWTQLSPATTPPARAGATLTFDANRDRAVLVGGRSTSGLLADVWEWDGTDWTEATPAQPLAARTGHGAVYDPSRAVVVVAGGLGAASVYGDTWEWNGSFWRERIATPALPARYRMAIAYDAARGEIVAAGGETDNGTVRDDTLLHQAAGSLSEPVPIATINRLLPRDIRQGEGDITFAGSGADPDTTDVITAYRWSLFDAAQGWQELSTERSFTRSASAFPVGEHHIRFEVQDNEGNWSAPVEEHILIRDPDGDTEPDEQPTWTLLIYAAADNNLDPAMGNSSEWQGMLYRLRNAGPQERVQVGILYDGPGINDTRRYYLDEDGDWDEETLGEARMDEVSTLRDFITWGRTEFQTDYYALALVDHANGVVGIAEDRTTDDTGHAFLTPIELRTALQAATDDGAHKLDVVHYDGCSFGLFENAAIAEGLAHFVVASPNTGWGVFAHDNYRQRAASADTPRAYAEAVANSYADEVSAYGRPYTISVFDMAHFDTVAARVSDFGNALLTYVSAEPNTRILDVQALRSSTQKYDSGVSYLHLDDEDSYVDLVDLTQQAQTHLDDPAVAAAAAALAAALEGDTTTGDDAFIIHERHRSGDFIYQNSEYTFDLDRAHGIGIFYPPRTSGDQSSAYVTYIEHELFDVTRGSGWTQFLATSLPPHLGGDPDPLSSTRLLGPLLIEDEQPLRRLYLPTVRR